MDKINCKHLKDGRCELASDHAGFDVVADERICQRCVEHEKHGSLNTYVTSQVYWTKKQLGLVPQDSVETHLEESVPIENLIGEGPGTELHRLIPSMFTYKGCGCKNFAKRMNIWGPNKCEANIKIITEHIVEKSKQSPLLGWVPSLATRIVAERLVKRAIAKARKKKAEIRASRAGKFNWFVAVTTAPRSRCTLKRSLQSMEIAGFDPFVFAEPGSTKVPGYPTIPHEEKKGIWHNWLYSCQYAIDNSDAEVIMTVQDDSLFHPDSKAFAESILWPSEQTGFVSLYTPKHYSLMPRSKSKRRDVGVNRIRTKSLWGACALIWPREVLSRVLEHKTTKEWIGAPTKTRNSKVMQRRKEDPSLVANSDTAIGKIMNSMGRHMFFVDPSPVQHIAEISTISHGGNTGRRNCLRCAPWSAPLAEQIPLEEGFEPVSELIF